MDHDAYSRDEQEEVRVQEAEAAELNVLAGPGPKTRLRKTSEGARLRFISSTISSSQLLHDPSSSHILPSCTVFKMAGTDAKFPIDMSKLQKCVWAVTARKMHLLISTNECISGLRSTRRSPSSRRSRSLR